MESLKRWLDARLKLEQASAAFLVACDDLRSSLFSITPFAPSHPNLHVLEDALSEIRICIDGIGSIENQILRSRATLNELLNKSTLNVPINRLPSEVLIHVFAILVALPPCGAYNPRNNTLQDITLVCKNWHRIATRAASLWCHIDIRVPDTLEECSIALNRARIHFNRSKSEPIHLHVFNPCEHSEIIQDAIISEVTSALEPHAASIASLEISGNYTGNWSRDFFELCSEFGTPHTVRNLIVNEGVESDTEWLSIALPGDEFRGLVDLTVSGQRDLCAKLDYDDLITTLFYSPKLHTLRIKNLRIEKGTISYAALDLPHLQLLETVNLTGEGVDTFISMLRPGSLELDVRFGFGLGAGLHDLQKLLARSNIVSMTIHGSGGFASGSSFVTVNSANHPLESCLSCATQLRSLLFDQRFAQCDPNTFRKLSEILTSPKYGFPQIRSFCVVGGTIRAEDIENWKRIVMAKSPRQVGFLDCTFLEGGPQLPWETQYTNEEPQSLVDFRGWLSDRVERAVVKSFMGRVPGALGVSATIEEFRRA